MRVAARFGETVDYVQSSANYASLLRSATTTLTHGARLLTKNSDKLRARAGEPQDGMQPRFAAINRQKPHPLLAAEFVHSKWGNSP